MVLLSAYLTNEPLGTPTESGLVNIVPSGFIPNGLRTLTSPAAFSITLGSGEIVSGIPFGSSGYYQPSGGFTKNDTYDATKILYGGTAQFGGSGLLRPFSIGSGLKNDIVFVSGNKNNKNKVLSTITTDPINFNYTYKSDPQQTDKVSGTDGTSTGGDARPTQQGDARPTPQGVPPIARPILKQ